MDRSTVQQKILVLEEYLNRLQAELGKLYDLLHDLRITSIVSHLIQMIPEVILKVKNIIGSPYPPDLSHFIPELIQLKKLLISSKNPRRINYPFYSLPSHKRHLPEEIDSLDPQQLLPTPELPPIMNKVPSKGSSLISPERMFINPFSGLIKTIEASLALFRDLEQVGLIRFDRDIFEV